MKYCVYTPVACFCFETNMEPKPLRDWLYQSVGRGGIYASTNRILELARDRSGGVEITDSPYDWMHNGSKPTEWAEAIIGPPELGFA